jgi:hypothetical protein
MIDILTMEFGELMLWEYVLIGLIGAILIWWRGGL